MKKNTIWWVIGGAVALFALTRLAFAKKANFLLQSIKPGGTILAPRIIIELLVQNPTMTRLTINSIVGNIFIEDKSVANVSSFTKQVIERNAESILKIEARPSLLAALTTLKNIIRDKPGNIPVRFSGSANVDGVNIPINQEMVL